MKIQNKKSGFTLLEILLVIGIIAILAGIVIVAINPSKQLAQVRNFQRKSDIKQIYNAITQYYIDNNSYPTTLSTTTLTEICNTGSVSNTATSTTGVACGTLTNLSTLVPIYLTAIPVDPSGASSTLTFIPAAYAAIQGTGYKVGRSLTNQLNIQASLAENTTVVIGTIPAVVVPLNISGLVAHYLMNDNAANTIVTDSFGSYGGTSIRNTSLMTISGLINSGLGFNGSSDYIESTNNIGITGAQARSVALWYKPTTVNGGMLFHMGTDNVNRGVFHLGANGPSTYGLYFDAWNYGSYSSSNNVLTPSQWNFIVTTFDGTTLKVYVNNSSSAVISANIASINTTSNKLIIGAENYLGSYLSNLTGYLDDVRVYNKALSLSEISQIYNGGVGTEGE